MSRRTRSFETRLRRVEQEAAYRATRATELGSTVAGLVENFFLGRDRKAGLPPGTSKKVKLSREQLIVLIVDACADVGQEPGHG